MKCLETQSVHHTKGRARRRFAAVLVVGVAAMLTAVLHPLPQAAKAESAEAPATPVKRSIVPVDSKAIRRARGWLRDAT